MNDAPAIWRERHIIDAFKGLTAPFVLMVMFATESLDRFDAWAYLAVHGVYGLVWVIKSRVFGDRNWERPLRPFRALLLVTGLGGYWAAPVVLCLHETAAPAAVVGAGVALFGLGVFLHFAADMQKHMHLQHRPGVLLTEGLWSRSRNPNYLGELLIYSAFCVLARHWLPVVLFSSVVLLEWVPNMMRKDRSLSRYPAFADWKARSGLLFPRLSLSDLKRRD
jgi:steroid 5-alpha reductase family enzyme